MFSLAPFLVNAVSTITFNETFDDNTGVVPGFTGTIADGGLNMSASDVALLSHKLINITSNLDSEGKVVVATCEMRTQFISGNGNAQLTQGQKGNSTSGADTNWAFRSESGIVKGARGDGSLVFDIIPHGLHYNMYKWIYNSSYIQVFVNTTIGYVSKGNIPMPGGVGYGNDSFFAFFCSSSCSYNVDWIACYNTTTTDTPDIIPPTFDGNSTNATNIRNNDIGGFSISATDPSGLSTFIFGWNDTGVFTNITNITIDGSPTSYNITFNETVTSSTGAVIGYQFFVNDSLNNFAATGILTITVASAAPSFSNNGINNTAPRIDDVVNINITLDTNINISGYIFSWDNGTGIFKNDSFVSIQGQGLKNANVNVNKTIERQAGTTITYKWFSNATNGDIGESAGFTVVVGGTSAPNITINADNFFSVLNNSLISLFESGAVLLNLSFADDIALFGFEITIKDFNGVVIYNLTNTSISGKNANFTATINVTGPQGSYDVNITSDDTHTLKTIPDYIIDKGFNYLTFNDEIRITADGAIWSGTKKNGDRYDFRFWYIPLFAPKTKVFYVESDNNLHYLEDSIFKAHFVDSKSKKWIDFEGISGKPIVTKINNKKWKVEFQNTDSKLIFSSIGGLNTRTLFFSYYLVNASVKWFIPLGDSGNYLGSSFSVSLNVTSNGRNTTRFRLYNSTNNLTQTVNISNTGNGTYFYNVTFSGLVDTSYTVNATHEDVFNALQNSTAAVLTNIRLTDCNTGANAINFTFKDEKNDSIIRADAIGNFNFNGTSPTETLTRTVSDVANFSVCILPESQSLTGDYDITYSATNYPQRILIVDPAVFSSATQTRDLLLLNTNDGIFATFRVIDSFQNPLDDTTVSYTKATDTIVIESKLTDDSGTVSFFIDPDQSYIFTFPKSLKAAPVKLVISSRKFFKLNSPSKVFNTL